MKLYLINKNPIISKLVALSVAKLDIEMEESQDINLNKSAEIVFIDDECFEQELFDSYKTENPETKFGLFYAKSTERLEGFNEYIQKPFLPTDLVKTLSKISGITPIDHQHTHKEDNMLEGESLDDLEEELDLSGFDDLQLDDGGETGDEPLDFGAQEGIEETEEDSNAPLDFGAQETAMESGDEQLDFGADSEEETQDLSVLDKGDVEEIKDLLADELDSTKEDVLNLGEELDIGDNPISADDLDFGDLGVEPDKTRAEDNNEEVSEDLQLENLQVKDDVQTNSADFAETGGAEDIDFGDLEIGETKNQESKDSIEVEETLESLPSTQDSQVVESNIDLDSLTDEIGLGSGLDNANLDSLGDSDLESNESIELGEVESNESQESLTDLDLGSLDLSNEDSETKNTTADVANDDSLEGAQGLGGVAESDDLSLEPQSEQIVFDEDLGESSKLESENLESTESFGADLEISEEIDTESGEPKTSEESSESGSNLDEFEGLSAEGMSEALGEPITKAPNLAPIVPKVENVSDSALPSNIQANSLESLINALQALQAQNLKDLLSGATISINIQFPKKD